MLAALENGEDVGFDGGSLGLVLGTIDPGAARQFNNRNDGDNRRRFILTSDDRLIETESFEPDRPGERSLAVLWRRLLAAPGHHLGLSCWHVHPGCRLVHGPPDARDPVFL
jgi:hypothetical protein